MERQRKNGKFPSEVRERAVRLVLESAASHAARWAALVSVSGKIGCAAETLQRCGVEGGTCRQFLCRHVAHRDAQRVGHAFAVGWIGHEAMADVADLDLPRRFPD